MRFGSLSVLFVLGVVGMSGCAGGGGAPTGNASPPDGSAYNPVPSVDALPPTLNPSTYQMPQGTYDTPPGQTNAGGIGTGVTTDSACAALCGTALALDCPDFTNTSMDQGPANNGAAGKGPGNGNQQATNTSKAIVSLPECTSACVQSFAEVPCPDQFAAALSCLLDHVTLTCDLLKSTEDQNALEQQLATSCQTPLLEYAACAGSSAQPQGALCDPNKANSCNGCTDPCEGCLCQNKNDGSKCTRQCQNM